MFVAIDLTLDMIIMVVVSGRSAVAGVKATARGCLLQARAHAGRGEICCVESRFREMFVPKVWVDLLRLRFVMELIPGPRLGRGNALIRASSLGW